jgi:hypothetical protein
MNSLISSLAGVENATSRASSKYTRGDVDYLLVAPIKSEECLFPAFQWHILHVRILFRLFGGESLARWGWK